MATNTPFTPTVPHWLLRPDDRHTIPRMNMPLRTALVLAAAAWSAVPVPQPPASTSPRTDHALGYYDARLGRVVLIGAPGDPADGSRDSVWSWSGAQWDSVTETGPPGRVNAGAAYDASRGVAIVAGGARKTSPTAWSAVADSWEGDRNGWKPIADIQARDHNSLVEDVSGAVLMFGGIPPERSAPWPSDTWLLRDGTWMRVATDGPGGRGRAALAFDRKRNEVVLFGGVGAPSGAGQVQTFFDDTWIWNGKSWRKSPATGPRGRYAHAMAFDERAGVVLLYSGAAAHRDAPLTDMWQWDGERWTEIAMTGPTPGYRYQPVMVHDRARGKTVMYGGIAGVNDTWEWDGRRWERR